MTVEQYEKRADEILERAKAQGQEDDFLFLTTFQRYLDHIAHLEELQKAIEEHGMMVTKEYVKKRANLYVNPAMQTYNSTAQAADKTAALLIKLITPASTESSGGDEFDNFN